MTKEPRPALHTITTIPGGKDPIRVIQDFLLSHKVDPDKCEEERSPDHAIWLLEINDIRIELYIDGLRRPHESVLSMSAKLCSVPIREGYEMIAAALELANNLVGVKVSLLDRYLMLSSSFSASGVSVDELSYNAKLIVSQHKWFLDALAEELGLEKL